MAASGITVLLTTGLLTPIDWAPILSKHLQLVTCMAQAVQATALAKQEENQPNPSQQRSGTAQQVETGSAANAGVEGGRAVVEGPLLALALQMGQTPLGAQVLLEQGITGFIPALAKWLLSPESGGATLTPPPPPTPP